MSTTPLPTQRSARVTPGRAAPSTVVPDQVPVDDTPVITLAKTDMKGWFRAHCISHQEVMETLILENRIDIMDDILSHTELWQTSAYDVKQSSDGVICNSTVARCVKSGSLDMLRLFDKYKLFDRKLPDKSWMHHAVDSGNINTCKYIYKHANHGVESDKVLFHELYFNALSKSNVEIFDWMRSKGVMTSIKFIFPNFDLSKIPVESLIDFVRNNSLSEADWSEYKGINYHKKEGKA